MTDVSVHDTANLSESVRVTMRHYLSTSHLYAARYAAEAADSRETALLADAPTFDLRHHCLVISAVMESVAFLEAAINEIFQDAEDGYPHHVKGLDHNCRELMAAFWFTTERGHRINTLDRYDVALRFAKKTILDRSRKPHQDVFALIKLRNHLMHYRPEEVGVHLEHKLADQLRYRFPSNALMESSGNPDFPSKILGAGCANWAWRSVRSLVEEFAQTMALRLHFQTADYGDPLPN